MCEQCSSDRMNFDETVPARPTLNRQLISDLILWAVADEREMTAKFERFRGWGFWNQAHWSMQARNGVCQTAFCMAGQAVVQVGYGIEYSTYDHGLYDVKHETILDSDRGETYTATYCAPKRVVGVDEKGNPKYELVTSERRTIEEVGAEVLGLTYQEAQDFFSGHNNLDRLEELANHFAEVRGIPESEFHIDLDEFHAICERQEQLDRERKERERINRAVDA